MNTRECFSRRSPAYWLLVRSETGDGREDLSSTGRTQAHTIEIEGSEEALALFSFEEEARMFVWCGTAGAGWRPRKTLPEELLQILAGSHSTTGFVALDPLPDPSFMGVASLVSLSRERFVDLLAKKANNDGAASPGS